MPDGVRMAQHTHLNLSIAPWIVVCSIRVAKGLHQEDDIKPSRQFSPRPLSFPWFEAQRRHRPCSITLRSRNGLCARFSPSLVPILSLSVRPSRLLVTLVIAITPRTPSSNRERRAGRATMAGAIRTSRSACSPSMLVGALLPSRITRVL